MTQEEKDRKIEIIQEQINEVKKIIIDDPRYLAELAELQKALEAARRHPIEK